MKSEKQFGSAGGGFWVGLAARCTAFVTASGPSGDADASNNTARLVIDVVDENDF